MPEQHFRSLLPSEDEIRQILAQTLIENPYRYPEVVLQIQLARLVARCFDKLNTELNESAKKVDDKFQAEVDEFTNKLEKWVEE